MGWVLLVLHRLAQCQLRDPNVIPFERRVGTTSLRSDGGLIVLAMRMRSSSMTAPVMIQFTRAFRSLWESIGDQRTLRANVAGSAASWADLGDPELASAAFSDAQSLPLDDMPEYRARISH